MIKLHICNSLFRVLNRSDFDSTNISLTFIDCCPATEMNGTFYVDIKIIHIPESVDPCMSSHITMPYVP